MKSSTRALVLVMSAALLAACGGRGDGDGDGGGGGYVQTAYIIGPQSCPTRSFTSLTLYIAEKTAYCSYLESSTSNNCPPVSGERVLQLVVGRASTTGPVAALTPGTYTTADLLYVAGMQGDGTTSCVEAGGSGTVTLTEVGAGGVSGSYSVTVDGETYTGDIDTSVCWAGNVGC